MHFDPRRSRLGLLIGSLLLLVSAPHAQEPTSAQIVQALSTPPLTRDIRGITVEDEEISLPSISLRVPFAYNSALVEGEALLSLRTLGKALQAPELADYNFLVVGHTDAKGSDQYNLALSESRAEAVIEHLFFYYSISPEKLFARGMGEAQLLDSVNPESDSNRRVEIINVTPATSARPF